MPTDQTATVTTPTSSTGDILQDQVGWFFRVNGDGSLVCLSGDRPPTGATVSLIHGGQPTGQGDALATRVAMVLARRVV